MSFHSFPGNLFDFTRELIGLYNLQEVQINIIVSDHKWTCKFVTQITHDLRREEVNNRNQRAGRRDEEKCVLQIAREPCTGFL